MARVIHATAGLAGFRLARDPAVLATVTPIDFDDLVLERLLGDRAGLREQLPQSAGNECQAIHGDLQFVGPAGALRRRSLRFRDVDRVVADLALLEPVDDVHAAHGIACGSVDADRTAPQHWPTAARGAAGSGTRQGTLRLEREV